MKWLFWAVVTLAFAAGCAQDQTCWAPGSGPIEQGGSGPVQPWPTGGLGDGVGGQSDPGAGSDETPESDCASTVQCRCEGQVFCEWIGTKDHPLDPDATQTMFWCPYVTSPGDEGWINGTCDQLVSAIYGICRDLIVEKPEVIKAGMTDKGGWECARDVPFTPGSAGVRMLNCTQRAK